MDITQLRNDYNIGFVWEKINLKLTEFFIHAGILQKISNKLQCPLSFDRKSIWRLIKRIFAQRFYVVYSLYLENGENQSEKHSSFIAAGNIGDDAMLK